MASHALQTSARKGRNGKLFASAAWIALSAAASGPANAANECGPDGAGADALTCAAGNYSSGIAYLSNSGLTLNLNDPGITVSNAAGAGIRLATGAIGAGDIVVNATNINSVTSSGRGIEVVSPSVGASASLTMANGTINTGATGSNNYGLYAALTNSAGTGDAKITFQGGSITTASSTSHGVFIQTAGLGQATILMTGGTVNAPLTASQGLFASITNAGSSATASVTMNGGTVTSASSGLMSQTAGTGQALTTMTGGAVSTTANNGHGVAALISAGAGSATVAMSGGSITTSGTLGVGLRSQAFDGKAIVRMTGGTIKTGGQGADGILATNQNGAGTYDISVTGGTVTGGGSSSAAIHGYAVAGGTIAIGANAILNAGTSGIALANTGLNAGAVTITTAGTLNGSINLSSNSANMLSITGGSIAGDINGGGNAALSFDLGANGSFTYGAPYAISGVSSIVLSRGTVQIDGTIASAAPVTVTGGRLAVNGSIATSAVTIASGGTLGGNGTVGATTAQSGSTVAPGNSIGTLHVNGAFVQNAGSVYQVEVDPTSNASDLIQVNGTATLQSGAGLNVVKNPTGEYRLGTIYTVLTASGGLSGTYAVTGETSGVSAFLGLRDSYDANNAYLTVVQTRDPVDAAQTPNQEAVADNLSGPVTPPVLNLPDDTSARAAFDQLGAQALASAKGALVSNGLYVRDLSLDRLRDVRCGTTENQNVRNAACDSEAPSLWAQGFGGWGGVSGNANASGLNHSAAGMLAGFDLPVMDWRAGLFAGFSNSDFHLTSGPASGESTDYHLGAYAGTNWDNINVSLGASYTWNAIRTDRSVAFGTFTDRLQGTTNAGVTQLFAEAGYGMEMMGTTLEPFANLAYLNLRTDGFTEVGGAAALTSQADTIENVISTFGVRPSTTLDLGSFPVTLRGMAGWRHTFGTVTPTSTVAFAGGNNFTVSGAPIARDAMALEAGFDFAVADNISAGLTYGGQLSSRTTDQTARGTIRIAF